MLRVKPGKFYRVENKDKKSSANDHYNMIIVEDSQGDIQELLFTDSDLTKAVIRGRKNKEDVPPYGIFVENGGFAYAFGLSATTILGFIIGYFAKNSGLF